MQRIMVIGCCGAGKSTLARKLAERTGLEVIHLDHYHWQPGWQEVEGKAWEKTVAELAARPQWIIDGNFAGTLDIRLSRADTVIYLDYPTPRCLWGVLKRTVKYHGQTRPDMAEGCHERFDWEFFHYVATFNLRKRKGMLARLANLSDAVDLIIFRNDREANQFLDTLPTRPEKGPQTLTLPR